VRGVTDIASPVLDRTGQAVATMSVPFLERLDLPEGPAAADVAGQVREIAERLSALLHYSGYNNVS
jgi:DNA-binding IclR family transcriptional regulator